MDSHTTGSCAECAQLETDPECERTQPAENSYQLLRRCPPHKVDAHSEDIVELPLQSIETGTVQELCKPLDQLDFQELHFRFDGGTYKNQNHHSTHTNCKRSHVVMQPFDSVERKIALDETTSKRAFEYQRLNWRPIALRDGYLCLLIVLSLGLAAFQEYLCRRSLQRDGLVFFRCVTDIDTLTWYTWALVPSILIVTYGVLIGATEHQALRLGPWYKLAAHSGLQGTRSILRDPLSYFWYLRHPTQAGPLIYISLLMSLLASVIVPVLQAASTLVEFDENKNQDTKFRYQNHSGRLKVNPIWSRCLTSTLVLVACCVIALQIVLYRSPSGLKASPNGIGGVLQVAIGGNLPRFIDSLETTNYEQQLLLHLASERFIMRNAVLWCKQQYQHQQPPSPRRRRSPQAASVPNSRIKSILSPQHCIPPKYLRVVFIVICLLTPVVATVISLTPASIVDTVPGLSALFAVVLKLLWGQLEVFLRVIEPFYRLHKGHASPLVLFREYAGYPIGLLPIKAFLKHDFALGIVGIGSILAEIMVLCTLYKSDDILSIGAMHCIPEPSNQRHVITSLLTTLCLSALLPVVLLVIMTCVWHTRRKIWLPITPGTVAAILSYTCGGKLWDECRDWHLMTRKELKARLDAEEKLFALGWFENSERCSKPALRIDEEPRLGPYVKDQEPPGSSV